MGYIGNAPYSGLVTGDNILDGSVKAEDLAPGAAVPSQTGQSGKYLTTDGTNASWGTIVTGVRVSGITYSGDDLATSPNGGQTVTLAGSGFLATPTVFVDGTIAPSVSFVSASQITFVTPAKSAGTYHVYVVNPDGSTAIFVNGISYSGIPTWSTAAGSLGTFDATLSIQLSATGDAPITYSLSAGSSLPAGVTLSSGGLISGTVNTEQTFSFSVDAIDAQNQETPRSFSVTISINDPYFEYTTLLLPGNGTNGAQNNTFLDSSTNAFSITRNGNTTQGTFSPFSQTGWGNYFDGTGDYLSGPTNNAAATFTGDFTIEAWFNFSSIAADCTIAACIEAGPPAELGWNFRWRQATPGFRFYSSSVGFFDFSYTPTVGSWTHVAISRSGTNLKCFINGTQIGSTQTASGTVTRSTSNPLTIGGGPYAATPTNGYLSNVRIVNGTAVYTANFTPPTTPLTAITNTSLLTCQSNRFIDNSSNAFAITRNGDVSVQAFSPFNPTAAWSASTNGGSGYFDGSGDYFSLPSSANLATGSSDFTIECWVYLVTAPTTAQYIFAGSGATIQTNVSGNFITYDGADRSLGTAYANQWIHLAVCRSGSTIRAFQNGTQTASWTSTGTQYTHSSGFIGAASGGTSPLGGYISNYRFVVGSAVYTANFTPPTAPLTAITNTQLLLNFTNAGIYDATSKNDLETVGNAQISTTQSKFGGSSMYFDGTGDYLFLPSNEFNAFRTGDFTVEFWIYFNALASNQTVAGTASAYQSGGWQLIQLNAANTLTFLIESNPWKQVNTGVLSTGQWYHIAITRYSGTLRMFVNGFQTESASSAESISDSSGNKLVIGNTVELGASRYLNGYIDDFRITKGIARYTSNFTPPTAAFKLR